MSKNLEQILAPLEKELQNLLKDKLKKIFLFGSYVRGEQRDDSDIDLLVEFKKNTYDNFINLVFSLEELFYLLFFYV